MSKSNYDRYRTNRRKKVSAGGLGASRPLSSSNAQLFPDALLGFDLFFLHFLLQLAIFSHIQAPVQALNFHFLSYKRDSYFLISFLV